MFEKELQKIVNQLKQDISIFENSGFIKDTKSQGGFLGITDEYPNYFYAYIKSEEEEDKYSFSQVDGKAKHNINVQFDFKMIFSTTSYIEYFDLIVFSKLLSSKNVQVTGFTDETESIYKIETGKDLKRNDFYLYSFSCSYEGETNIKNLINCIKDQSIKVNYCLV